MTHVLIVALLNVQYYRKFIGNFQHILGNGPIMCMIHMQGKPPWCLWSRRSSLSIVRIDMAIRLGLSNPSWSWGASFQLMACPPMALRISMRPLTCHNTGAASLFTCSSLVPVTTYFPQGGGKV